MHIIKKILLVTGLLIPTGLYFMYNTERKDASQAKKELTVSKPTVAEYKTIFKKKKIDSKIDNIHETTDLESINQDVDSIIVKADKFIKTHNLKVAAKVQSEKEMQQKEQFDATLQDLQQELEELDHES